MPFSGAAAAIRATASRMGSDICEGLDTMFEQRSNAVIQVETTWLVEDWAISTIFNFAKGASGKPVSPVASENWRVRRSKLRSACAAFPCFCSSEASQNSAVGINESGTSDLIIL